MFLSALALRQRIEAFAPAAGRTAVDGTSGMAAQVSAYYREHPAGLHADIVEMDLADQAMSQFVRLKFPPGLVGLLVAALMAATMSSIDSGVHSITTALVIDFRDRLLPASGHEPSQQRCGRLGCSSWRSARWRSCLRPD